MLGDLQLELLQYSCVFSVTKYNPLKKILYILLYSIKLIKSLICNSCRTQTTEIMYPTFPTFEKLPERRKVSRYEILTNFLQVSSGP